VQGKQKTEKSGWSCEGMLETESSKGAHSAGSPEAVVDGGAETLLDKILDRDNLNQAYKRVVKNGGAAGVDDMSVDKMLPYLKEHREEIIASIRGGWYKPKPVKRVEIPKPDGGVRQLGIPKVTHKRIPRINRIFEYFQKIRGTALKSLNRLVPDGTLGGVRGRAAN